MTQIVSNFIQTNSYWTIAASSLCAVTTIEMAIRTIGGLGAKISGSDQRSLYENLKNNLAGTIFYALCAANIVPGSAKLGALVFTSYSAFSKTPPSEAYLTSIVLNNIALKVIAPTYEKTTNLIKNILAQITFPETPLWRVVSITVLAIGAYHFGPKIAAGTKSLMTPLVNQVLGN
ncbi:hypothetical protein [Simkania sp.]|uniref:hypothetical protein n=1 Tax=Simkania sp. TaxID=34094 RepID=UPI003B522B6F